METPTALREELYERLAGQELADGLHHLDVYEEARERGLDVNQVVEAVESLEADERIVHVQVGPFDAWKIRREAPEGR